MTVDLSVDSQETSDSHNIIFVVVIEFPPYLEKCNILKKWENTGISAQTWNKIKICKFNVSKFIFQDVIYKINLIDIFVISTLSTQTQIQSQTDLGFHYFYLEITWIVSKRLVKMFDKSRGVRGK